MPVTLQPTSLKYKNSNGVFQNATAIQGESPVVAVADITNGHRITITDAEGAHSFDVMDGNAADAPVQSVNGKTGTVMLDAQDVGAVSKESLDNAGISSRSYTTILGGEFTVTTAIEGEWLKPHARASVTGGFNKHYMYRITIDGTEYVLPARLWFEGKNKVYEYIGNLSYHYTSIDGVPGGTDDVSFLIINDLDDNGSIDVLTSTAGTYTIKIEEIRFTQKELPHSLVWGNNYVPILTRDGGGSTYNGTSIGVNCLNNSRGTFAIGYLNGIDEEFGTAIGIRNHTSAFDAIAIGNGNDISGSGGIAIGQTNDVSDRGVAIGNDLTVNGTNMIALGRFNISANKSFPRFAANTVYHKGDIVVGKWLNVAPDMTWVCRQDHTSANSAYISNDTIDGVSVWLLSPSTGDTLLAVGNGSLTNSNALKVDIIGNMFLGGDVFVNSNADSTGGTKLATVNDIPSVPVQDVQVNGVSVLSNGVANVPKAASGVLGVVKPGGMGIAVNSNNGEIYTVKATSSQTKAGTTNYTPIVPSNQHESTFYGLAKAAGDATQATSDNAVGTYTNEAKAAINTMIGSVSKESLKNAGISAQTYTEKFNGEFTVTTATTSGWLNPYVRASVTGRISKHYMHRVTFNGTEYVLPTRLWYSASNGDIKVYEYLGNLGLYISDISGVPEGTDNVPFIIISDLNNSSSIDVLTQTAGTYTILVEQINNTQIELPKSLIWKDSYVPIEKNNNGGTYNGYSIGVNELKNQRGTFAFGYGNKIENEFGFALGEANILKCSSSYVEGSGNEVTGINSGAHSNHVEGYLNKFTKLGIGNHIEGMDNKSNQLIMNTHVEGISNEANGTIIHIEGYGNIANGGQSHIEGTGNIGNGSGIHVQGQYNIADTLAPEWAANTEYSVGDYIYKSYINSSTPYGCFICIEDNNDTTFTLSKWKQIGVGQCSDTLMLMGNGSGKENRSNALKVDWIGNMHLGGNVYVNSAADSTGGTKVATVEDVPDIQINGTSIVNNGVANVPMASTSELGVVKVNRGFGIMINPTTGDITVAPASSAEAKSGAEVYKPITPVRQHESAFYGLAKAAGDTTQAVSDNAVGTYTNDAKTAIKTMLGVTDPTISDVQVNSVSVLGQNGVANVPIASSSNLGVVKAGSSTQIYANGSVEFRAVGAGEVKAGTTYLRALTPERQHASVFYGLAKAAGADMASSSNAIGTYTDAAKSAISEMLNGAVSVSGTTPTITALSGIRYVCGEVATLSFTPSATGICDVTFTSGSTATVLTVPSTVKWPTWFDPTDLEANVTYELNIMDGVYGAVTTWT